MTVPPHRLGMTLPMADEPLSAVPGVVDELAAAGYTDLWTSEINALDAFAPLTVAALHRPELRVGTSIAGVFARSPALLAMNALALAESSPQPVYLGLGASSETMVRDWHGVPYVRPYQRVRDTLRFLHRAFEGERVTFRSPSFDVDGFRLGRLPEHRPRILLAALRERMLGLAGREADGVILNWLGADDVARVVPPVLEHNPAAEVVARLFVVVGADRAAARELAVLAILGPDAATVRATARGLAARPELAAALPGGTVA
ncbi:LLM class flavin-dependent oxidoreductase [Nocardia sp. alder85J]|uniref:LLM class flavin-dependent oxidoreductase n=1 Tax=Nocardia sp. alder85J TaxID=2862949 RepID=UPI001CD63C12|nr:LLM class flavin-dependent oxidoreductase [Nocardia sp. alder85J]MCX4096826.1 LLM class flavin-dependent oxidoreductase [Nocardia sp. alder85J]